MSLTGDKALTGVVAFDVPELLEPLSKMISDIQQQINKAKLSMISDMHRDPVPQFKHEQIQDATQFLNVAVDAMHCFIDNFKAESLKEMDEDTIKMLQEKTRESVRRLVLLFGDRTSEFNGSNMKGQLIGFQEASQSTDIRERIKSLALFLKTFGKIQWLGQMTSSENFQQKQELAVALLQGLLNPSKATLSSSNDYKNVYPIAKQELAEIEQQMSKLEKPQRDAYGRSTRRPQCLSEADENTLHELKEQQRKLQSLVEHLESAKPHHRNGYSCYGDYGTHYGAAHQNSQPPPKDVCNPLSEMLASSPHQADGSSSALKLKLLGEMCTKLSIILEQDEQKKIEMEEQLQKKMATLKIFAEALNRVPEVLNQYVLIRLGDIDTTDLSVLKGWITRDEADRVHQMLETFRDEAIYERAIREVTLRTHVSWHCRGSESVTSAKEYLFINSIGQASAERHDDEFDEEDDALEDEQANPVLATNANTESGIRRKPSHRQRKRRANFFASMPRTPSCQS